MTAHARPMTADELRASLRDAWIALDAAQANLDRATPYTSPWVARALAGTLPAPTIAPVVRRMADEGAPRPRTLRYSEQLALDYDGAYWRVIDRETGGQLGTATRKREEAEIIAAGRIRSGDYR